MSRWVIGLLALAVPQTAYADESPDAGATLPRQTVIFYNARLALRDQKPAEALKLWLLRNSIADQGPRGVYDEEFRSVVWAALGNLGLCQDGYPKDDRRHEGAGLWPLALHNWVIRAAAQGPSGAPTPFNAFEIGIQQRLVSLQDVLTQAELKSVSFFTTECYLMNTTLLDLGQGSIDLTDRLSYGRVLRRLLIKSLQTLVREKVLTLAAVEARIFDLDLALSALQARQARQNASVINQKARSLGMSKPGAAAAGDVVAKFPENSEQAAFLRRTLQWKTSEWLTLNRQRRQFLFSQARPFASDPSVLDPLMLSIVDELIARGEGAELSGWIGNLKLDESAGRRSLITQADRGKRLLDLEPASGFTERSTIALHRGVAYLEAGQLQDALRSFAFAMAHADESKEATKTMALSRRWLSFVLSRYETNEEVLGVLKALVPRVEYNAVIEDLIWRAALRADAKSFDKIVATALRGGAFDSRATRLRLMAQGKPGEMATQLRDSAADEPYLTLRFTRQLLDKLEAEEPDVRAANVPMMKALLSVLDFIASKSNYKTQVTAAEDLMARLRAILEGLSAFDTTPAAQARALSTRHESFAGNIRLAPADPLPWPFVAPEPEAPSAFVPLLLQPVEWRDENNTLVYGWRLTE